MTTDQATYAAILALDDAESRRRLGTARARTSTGQQLTSAQGLRPGPANQPRAHPVPGTLHLLADTQRTGSRSLHPGDVIFWVACLGGASLLLFSATL